MVAGRPQSLWGLGGNPGAGAFDTTLNGVVLSSSSTQVNGQIPFSDPVSGDTYLSRLQAAATIAGTLLLCDRLWHNGGFTITSTSAQSITSPTWPARDNAGSTNGDGVLLGLEISAAAGAAAPLITIAYTNQAGTSGRSAFNSFATANSPTAGAFFPIGLQAGDTGVRSVQSLLITSSWVSGTMNLVAYRPIASLELPVGNVSNAIDALTSGFPKLFNGAVPFFLFIPSTTTASNISGSMAVTQG
ncbi:MAG: hypothetical protein ABI574_00940 [Burkholderiales bacterium]